MQPIEVADCMMISEVYLGNLAYRNAGRQASKRCRLDQAGNRQKAGVGRQVTGNRNHIATWMI